MTRKVVTVLPETSVGTVAEMLANERFGSLPVVDAEGRVLGIVTEENLVTRAANLHLPRYITFLGGVIFLENPRRFTEEAEKILAVTAREIMDVEVPFVHPDAPVELIAERMLNEDLRRVVVLDEKKRLIGIITRADIVRMQTAGGRLPTEPSE